MDNKQREAVEPLSEAQDKKLLDAFVTGLRATSVSTDATASVLRMIREDGGSFLARLLSYANCGGIMMRLLGVMLFAAGVSVPLLAQGSMGFLAVKADPGRAGVFLDGKYLGPAKNLGFARTYTVAPGEHELKLEEPRYEEVTTKVMIAAGKKTTVSQTMKALAPAKPPFGRVRTENADKFAAVYVNDRFMGHSGEFDHGAQYLLLNPGDYTVKIAAVSGNPITQTIKVEADKTVVVR